MPRAHRRRHATAAVLCPLLALATTIAIAWTSALFVRFGNTHAVVRAEAISPSEWWHLGRQRAPAALRYRSIVMPRALEYTPHPQTAPIPRWTALPAPTPNSNDHYEIVDARGWPLPALLFRFHGRGSGAATTGTVTGGLALTPHATGAWYDPRALPYTPIWPNLLADTALFTLLWSTLLFAPGALRGHLRRRAGRCPTCAYDLRATPSILCPECGSPVPRRDSPTSPHRPHPTR